MDEEGSFDISVGIDEVIGAWLDGGRGGRSDSSRSSNYRFGGSDSALVRDLGFQLEIPGFRFLRRFLRRREWVFYAVRFLSKGFLTTRYKSIRWRMGYTWSSFLLPGDPSVKVEDRILCFCFEQVAFVRGWLVVNKVERGIEFEWVGFLRR
jgi:hypothetical protein